MFIAVPFWFGVYYIIKYKLRILYPIVAFIIFEMISLVLILNGLEFRKSIPHIPLIYIIAFWFMNYYDNRSIRYNKIIHTLIILYIIIVPIILLVWEFK